MDASRLFRIAARVAAEKFRRDLEWWHDCCKAPPIDEAPKYWREDISTKLITEIIKDRQATTIQWVKPTLEDERPKIEKIAQSLGLDYIDTMQKAGSGFLDILNNEWWAKLQGSDSWTVESMEEAEKLASLREEDLQPILDLIAAGKGVPAPVILFS